MQILFTTQLSHRLINCSLPLFAQLGARIGKDLSDCIKQLVIERRPLIVIDG